MIDNHEIKQKINETFEFGGLHHINILDDGAIEIDASHTWLKVMVEKLPIGLSKVHGVFSIRSQGLSRTLTTLEGCPKYVGKEFFCSCNQISDLEGGPEEANGYYAFNCPLTSLNGLPRFVGPENFCLDYSTNLPLLRLVTVDYESFLGKNHTMHELLKSVRSENLSKKQKAWEFQKRLVEAGCEGNAKW
jgi:hypothetical protein